MKIDRLEVSRLSACYLRLYLLLLAASQARDAGLSFQAIRILRACRISQSADGPLVCLGGVVLWATKRYACSRVSSDSGLSAM